MHKEKFYDNLFPEDFSISGATDINPDLIEDAIFGNPEEVSEITEEPQDPSPKEEDQPKEGTPKKEEAPKIEESAQEVIENYLGEEEEEAQEEEAPAPESDQEEEEETSSDSIFTHLGKDLYELGIFSKGEDGEEDYPTTPEELKERFEKEISIQSNQRVYNFLMSQHGEEGVAMFNDIFVKGVSPKEYLSKYNEIQSLDGLDMSLESNQARVYREYYKSLDWEDEEIEASIAKLKDYGDLEDEANKVYKKLLKTREEELQRMAAEKEEKQRLLQEQQQEYQNSLQHLLHNAVKTRDFEGIPITEKVAQETMQELTQMRYRLPSGDTLTEFDKYILELRRPENLSEKVKLWLLARSNFDFTKIKKKAISENGSVLFKSLAKKQKTKEKTSKMPNSSEGFGAFL